MLNMTEETKAIVDRTLGHIMEIKVTCGENNYHAQVVENCIIYDDRMNSLP